MSEPYQPPHDQQQPPQVQQPYPYPPNTMQPPKSTDGFAIASLVLGILWISWIGSALAVVFGHISLGRIKREGYAGRGLAVAGLVLGYIGVGTFLLFSSLFAA